MSFYRRRPRLCVTALTICCRLITVGLVGLCSRKVFPGLSLHATTSLAFPVKDVAPLLLFRDIHQYKSVRWRHQRLRKRTPHPSIIESGEGFVSWDGEYFLAVSMQSPPYLAEHSHMFFPLYPALLRNAAKWALHVGNELLRLTACDTTSEPSCVNEYLVAGILLSNIFAVIAALGIYEACIVFQRHLRVCQCGCLGSTATMVSFTSTTVCDPSCPVVVDDQSRSTNGSDAVLRPTEEENRDCLDLKQSFKRIAPPSPNVSSVRYLKPANRHTKTHLSVSSLKRSTDVAFLAAVLFSFNAANVFLSSVYSESIFAALTSWGVVLLITSEIGWSAPSSSNCKARQAPQNITSSLRVLPPPHLQLENCLKPLSLLGATICFALASAARSNGVFILIPFALRTMRCCPLMGTFSRTPRCASTHSMYNQSIRQDSESIHLPDSGAPVQADGVSILRRSQQIAKLIVRFATHWIIAFFLGCWVVLPMLSTLGYAFATYCVDSTRGNGLPAQKFRSNLWPELHHSVLGMHATRHDVTCFLNNFIRLGLLQVQAIITKLNDKDQLTALLLPVGEKRNVAPLWCNFTIPNVYSYIQRSIWNVKPFGYWKLQKVDRFLMALPFYCVAAVACLAFMKRFTYSFTTKCFPVRNGNALGRRACFYVRRFWEALSRPESGHELHLTVLAGYMFFVANAEVFIRLAVGCPLFYLYASQLLMELHRTRKRHPLGACHLLSSEFDSSDAKDEHETHQYSTGWILPMPLRPLCRFLVFNQAACFVAGCVFFSKFVTWT